MISPIPAIRKEKNMKGSKWDNSGLKPSIKAPAISIRYISLTDMPLKRVGNALVLKDVKRLHNSCNAPIGHR